MTRYFVKRCICCAHYLDMALALTGVFFTLYPTRKSLLATSSGTVNGYNAFLKPRYRLRKACT
jgi:hypothetical protein